MIIERVMQIVESKAPEKEIITRKGSKKIPIILLVKNTTNK